MTNTTNLDMEALKEREIKADFELKVNDICNGIASLVIDKNRKYGNSALSPMRIFSKADALEQILVRIDDKLARISNQNIDDDEDVIKDLIGYLVLLQIALSRK